MAKASDAEVEIRVTKVIELILEGKGRQAVVRYAANEWGLESRQVDTYYLRAWERIHDDCRASRQENISRTLNRLDSTLYRAIQKGDLHAEIKVIAQQCKILGIEIAPMEQVERIENVSNDELDRLTQEMVIN